MSHSYDRYERRRQTYGASTRRSTLGYWVPLAITVTAATIGFAAWIWSERQDSEDDSDDGGGSYRDRASQHPQGYDRVGSGEPEGPRGSASGSFEDAGMMARMSGALRRTPSPQQLFDGASRKVAAGVAAAGAVVGGALSSIREEDKRDFEDHSRWSEEAESRNNSSEAKEGPSSRPRDTTTTETGTSSHPTAAAPQRYAGSRRKTVALVISSESSHDPGAEEENAYHEEHAVSFIEAYDLK